MNNLNRSAIPGKYLVDCDGCGGVYYQDQVRKDQYGLLMCEHCIDPLWYEHYHLPKHKHLLEIQPASTDTFTTLTDPSGQYDDSSGIDLN